MAVTFRLICVIGWIDALWLDYLRRSLLVLQNSGTWLRLAILVMFPTLRPNDTYRVLILTLFLYSPGFLDDDAASSQ